MNCNHCKEAKFCLDQIRKELHEVRIILDSIPKTEYTDKALEEAKAYMMKEHNIGWLDDTIEENVYDVLIACLKKFL